MPILVLVSLALQIACAVHVVRSGRQLYWIWILLIGSYLGVIVYVIAAVIPDLRNDPRSRQAARKLVNTFDPERQRRSIQQRLEIADTVNNRRVLAEESMKLGDYASAADCIVRCSRACMRTMRVFCSAWRRRRPDRTTLPARATTLDTLYAAHADFRSSDAELLRARVLEALGDRATALEHYRALATSYPGEEARFRYGALLKQAGRFSDARQVFGDMLKRAQLAPRYYRRKEKDWLDSAKRELASLGPG